jgi:hypothetical protein
VKHTQPWYRRVGTPVGVGVALLIIAAAFGAVLRLKGLSTAANIAQLFSIPLGLLPVVPAVVKWWQERRKQPVVTPEDLTRAKTHLSALLLDQWRTESQLRALDDPDPIPVRWGLTTREGLLDRPSNRTADALTVASSEDIKALVAEFRRLRRRRLVILGGAGAGKTTLAVQILLELLRPTEIASTGPVPVLFSLSGWDVATQDYRDWVADRIIHDYPALAAAGLGPHVIRALVDRNQILPILDGLDEMPIALQEGVIEALNKSMERETELILTSRTEAYGEAVESAGRVLSSAVVLEPESVTPRAAADYLERCLPKAPSAAWGAILDGLRHHPQASASIAALAQVGSSPLGLWLIRMAYISSNVDPSVLLDSERFGSTSAVRAHLFDQLIRACIQARPPSNKPTDVFRPRNRYEPEDVERWLRFLATNLERRGTRDFDWTRDVAVLAPPVRWPADATAVSSRWAPVVRAKISPILADLRAFGDGHPGISAVLVAVTAAWGAGSLSLISPFFMVEALEPIRIVVALFLGFVAAAALAVGVWIGLERKSRAYTDRSESDSSDIDWPAAIDRDRDRARRAITTHAQVISFGVACGAPVGLTVGAATGSVLGEGPGLSVGLVVGGLIGFLSMVRFRIDSDRPPGAGSRRRWYGMGPGPGLRSGIFIGIALAVASALPFALVYTSVYDGVSDEALTVALVAFLPLAAVLCAVFVAVRAIVIPVVFGAASLATIPMRVALGLSTTEPTNKRPDALEVWQHERRGQQFRLLQLVVVTALLTAAVIGSYLLGRDSPQWAEIRVGGPAEWLSAHLPAFDLTWSGHLRYGVAVVLGWLVTIQRYGHRGWRRWTALFMIAAAVSLFWPSFARPDDFHFRLVGQFDRLESTFDGHAMMRFGGWTGSTAGHQIVDIDRLIGDWHFVRFFGVLFGIVALLLVATIGNLVDGSQSRVWWAMSVAIFWHTVRGRLPRNLMIFLDDAHRLGLMRSTGTAYQFRHAELQDYLARSPEPEPFPPIPTQDVRASHVVVVE